MGSIPQLSILKGKQSPLYERLLHRTFEERVDKDFGEKTALIFRDEDGEERITNYNTLNSSANRMASALLDIIASKGLQANDEGDWIIAVCMKPTDHLVASLLSCWKCGGKPTRNFQFQEFLRLPVLSSRVFAVGRYFSG